jgi:hypothetical protein
MAVNCSNFPISDVMTLDKSIQYVGIYHNHSGNVDDDIREDISSYFEHTKPSQGGQLQVLSTKTAQKRLGQFQYAMAKFDDVILYTFSINEHDLLLVSTGPAANSDLVISRVLDFLRR